MINTPLVSHLITTQFPQWKDLPIQPVACSGWDNRTFHLGHQMLIRMPSGAEYSLQVEKEQRWLPRLAPMLPLPIPIPVAMGEASENYPWKWSIYRWLEGETAALGKIDNLSVFAADLAQFLVALQRIDATGGPLPGLHSFYRGGALAIYDTEVRQSLLVLKDKINIKKATEIWDSALATNVQIKPVWVHGDVSSGNLLIQQGRLSAVIDFGQLAVGDPACDLAIAWTLFHGESRKIFQSLLPLDIEIWIRGRAWTLWKALVTAAGLTNPGNNESANCWRILEDVISSPLS